MGDDGLRRAVLELGLEDDIPLWEVFSDCQSAGLIPAGTAGVEALAETLLDLARQGKVRVLAGRWDDPHPRYVDLDEAARLLADARRYTSDEEIANDLERVYYVNVDDVVE